MNSNQDHKVIEILGGHESVRAAVDAGELTTEQYEALFPIYMDEMPYGTAKARTGDPEHFILKELENLAERLVPEEKSEQCPHTNIDFPKIGTEHIKICRDCGEPEEERLSKDVADFVEATKELSSCVEEMTNKLHKKEGLPLTSERIRQYHEDQTCLNPDCDGDATDGLEWDAAEFQGDECYQTVTCTKCGWKWDDRYAFEGVVDVRDDDRNGIQDWAGTKWEEVISSIISQTDLLPTLMGIHPDLDELIEQKLKEA